VSAVHLNSYPYYPDAICITWEIVDSPAYPDAEIWVERSGSPEGPWERRHTLPLVNVGSWVDQDQQYAAITKQMLVYYRVVAKLSAARTITSGAISLFGPLNKDDWMIARKLNEKEHLRFKKIGVPLLVIKRKYWGTPCSCRDQASSLKTKDFCEECYGTGLTGGFYDPIPTCGEIVENARTTDLNEQGLGVVEEHSASLRLSSYPIIVRDDLVIEENTNIRWNVWEHQYIEWRRVPVAQTAVLKKIPPSSIRYRVEYTRNTDGTYHLDAAPPKITQNGEPWRKRTG